jgi:aminoglycoside-2''-adenylyltransferase
VELFTALFTALDRANVRYVVVGGLATVLHGHPRLTADVDLVIDLGSEPSRRAMTAFQALGLKPRRRWISVRAKSTDPAFVVYGDTWEYGWRPVVLQLER